MQDNKEILAYPNDWKNQ